MTYSLYHQAEGLLCPKQFYIATAIAADPRIVPAEPGIYGWWFDNTLPIVPMADSIEVDGRRLLYVGICPSGVQRTSGNRTLRHRMKNHCRGPIAQSTLRRTLTSLLRETLDLTVDIRGSKKAMPPEDEQRLTAWMSEHARVGWMPHGRPWELENLLIRGGPRLPLNILGSTDPFVSELRALRRKLGSVGNSQPGICTADECMS
jgi:hypothetical protein